MSIVFIHGANGKPAASRLLEESLSRADFLTGECFFGFPLIAAPEGNFSFDATFVSPQLGIVLLDLVEGHQIGNFTDRQDDLYNKMESKLKLHRELMDGRSLRVPLSVITFAPAIPETEKLAISGYPIANHENLLQVISASLLATEISEDLYKKTLSAIESLSAIRSVKPLREVHNHNSRGAILNRIEQSIGTLDYRQSRAVIETVEGVQRIRGLAGSGKSIVLALKAAYLHAQYPDWRIAVTFHTRSLKDFFCSLITKFCISQTGLEPDWDKVRVINAWGSHRNRDGIYSEFCNHNNCKFYPFDEARVHFGAGREFAEACQQALRDVPNPPGLYDAILVDEAQDLPPEFLRLCYSMLRGEPKRLVYAYDELQNLSGMSVLPPEEIFGTKHDGRPVVELRDNTQDIILSVCYRNSRPVLVTAHALGFGIYRQSNSSFGENENFEMVQMFERPQLWIEVGYEVREGSLGLGHYVVLQRSEESSPKFLEDHSPLDDIVCVRSFASAAEQIEWLIEQVRKNLYEDELRPSDILVVDPVSDGSQARLKFVKDRFVRAGIKAHLVGHDTHPDIFFVDNSVAISNIHRAKGNEVGMVYVINAHLCECVSQDLLRNRNGLFTAITRSKAWVRLLGVGEDMQKIVKEVERVRLNDFRLAFTHPTEERLQEMRVIRADISKPSPTGYATAREMIEQLIAGIESGEIDINNIDDDTRNKVIELMQKRGNQNS